MTHYLNGFVPDVECPRCNGNGWLPRRWGFNSRVQLTEENCPDCCGHGWRPMTQDEIDDAAEQQADDSMSEPPMSMDEQHRAAWAQKQELRR